MGRLSNFWNVTLGADIIEEKPLSEMSNDPTEKILAKSKKQIDEKMDALNSKTVVIASKFSSIKVDVKDIVKNSDTSSPKVLQETTQQEQDKER